MPYTKVIAQLKANLQTAYRQAVDADNSLDQLKQQGHAKFAKIFTDDQGFTTSSNRFLPYVQELAELVAKLEQDKAPAQQQLEHLVKQLAILLQTLARFKEQGRQ
ncbi:prephenate dehydrogenase [Shewanella dokdonensis]|uniref:Prephenate dehydrogenase n=1 Tax=Shewanella dokdonensis TaxID=712036 RepID=A0ABX8DHG9_9GAMM|nr:prephenate dehydrogenase [Shewanella dokdonensis]MCL1075865.1 prephenate dehydrogenase [Shewanella dokdonensis]QVK24197.1 prephenate dehydrogenase [Shewanella dokdonensis]